jgi:uncharacterized protein
MKSKRVVLDTNLWIYFLISKELSELDELLDEKKVTLLFSEESLNEFIAVSKRPKFQSYFTDKKVTELFRMFEKYGELVKIVRKVQICRDKNDDFLINLALSGKANYLVSGDADLLVIGQVEGIQILPWREFIAQITR